MSSAHGAGLMLIPVLMAHPTMGMHHDMSAMMPHPAMLSIRVILLAVLIHTVAMLIVAGILAIVFFESYERSGLNLLRHAWFNFDLLWALALIVAAFAALLS
jgi:cation transport ATPase